MDKQKVLVAIASSDGIVVNSHFGKTDKFYIYEVCEEPYEIPGEIRESIEQLIKYIKIKNLFQ